MKNTNIEVEGGEILIQSKEGHYAVIPAKNRQEVIDMVKDNCDGCINSYIQGLPKEADYAQDGTLLPSWDKVKATINPNNWGVTDYTDKKDFNSAYAAAKKAGEKEFMWNNKRFNTAYAGTPRQEVGAYGIKGNLINNVEYPIQVNKFDAFGENNYLPGHISAGYVGRVAALTTRTSVNKTSEDKTQKSELDTPDQSLYVYDSSINTKNIKPGYNLITNNCANAVCDALSLNDKSIIETPSGVVKKLLSNEQYPSLDVTGRTYRDYSEKLLYEENILDNSKYWLGISASPDNKNLSKKVISKIQRGLTKKGYALPTSTKEDGNFDGVWGKETKQALLDYQTKNKTTK